MLETSGKFSINIQVWHALWSLKTPCELPRKALKNLGKSSHQSTYENNSCTPKMWFALRALHCRTLQTPAHHPLRSKNLLSSSSSAKRAGVTKIDSQKSVFLLATKACVGCDFDHPPLVGGDIGTFHWIRGAGAISMSRAFTACTYILLVLTCHSMLVHKARRKL